jgi:hypothetical protein
LTERVPYLDCHAAEEIPDWKWTIEGLKEERMRAEYMEEEEEREMERKDVWNMSPERARFFTSHPHVIYGFHLRYHRWKKFLVRYVRPVPGQEWGPSQDMVVGEAEKGFLERLLAPGEPGPYERRPLCRQKSPRAVMTVRGPASKEAIEAVSIMARSPLYRVRIATESEAGLAERTLQQAAMLANEWECNGGHRRRSRNVLFAKSSPRSVDAAVAPLLRFLDAFKGIVVLFLPDEDVQMDLRIEQRVCASFHFEYRDASPACRRVLRRQCFKKDPGFYREDLSPEYEKCIDKTCDA